MDCLLEHVDVSGLLSRACWWFGLAKETSYEQGQRRWVPEFAESSTLCRRIDQQQLCVNSRHQLASPFMNAKQSCRLGCICLLIVKWYRATAYQQGMYEYKTKVSPMSYCIPTGEIWIQIHTFCLFLKELPIFWERKEFWGKFCHILTVLKMFWVCFSTSFLYVVN
jgi:hypothetical protein